MTEKIRQPITILSLLTTVLIAAYLLFEFQNNRHNPQNVSVDTLIEVSLNQAENVFREYTESFAEDTRRLYHEIHEGFQSGTSPQLFNDKMNLYPFWGASLYRNGELYVWQGFAPDSISLDNGGDFSGADSTNEMPLSLDDTAEDELSNQSDDTAPPSAFNTSDAPEVTVTVERARNVVYLAGHMEFRIGENDTFHLFTRKKISQENILPIGQNQEFQLSSHSQLQNRFPVDYLFFESVPDSVTSFRTLHIQESDSVGVVIASDNGFSQLINQYENRASRWRSLFYAILFILITSIFLIWSFRIHSWYGMFLQIIGLFLLWSVFLITDLPIRWIPYYFPEASEEVLRSMTAVTSYAINALFICFITVSVITTLTRKWRVTHYENHFRTILFAILFGAFSIGLTLFYLLTTYNAALDSNIPLIDLQMIPDLTTWIFFISSGIFISSIAAMLITVLWFLFTSEKDKSTLITSISLVSYLFFFLIADLTLAKSLISFWVLSLSMVVYLFIITGALYIFRYPRSFLQLSGFRLLIISILLSASSGYLIFSNAHYERMDSRLQTEAIEFSQEQDAEAEAVARQLLTRIEQNMITLTATDFNSNRESVLAQFQRAVQLSLPPQSNRFSFDVRLLSTDGDVLSDYVTNFGTSVNYYDDNFMRTVQRAYSGEQLGQNVNQPIVRSGPSFYSNNYSTFYRGWIPLYDSSQRNTSIAQIVAAVYIERPDLTKPLRAFLTASTSNDWKTSYHLTEFRDSVNVRSTVKGIYANQPSYNMLPLDEAEIANRDSLAYITTINNQGEFRELIMKMDGNRVILASTPFPGFNSHLFSYFRYIIIITIAGLILFPLLKAFGLEIFGLFSQSRKFGHRLIDGLTLATLLFLILLILATHYAVTNQHTESLQREMITKLDNLAETTSLFSFSESDTTLPDNQTGTQERVSTFADSLVEEELEEESGNLISEFNTTLSRAVAPLDADAIFYRNQMEMISTTPQIFQQSLIPRMLPYPVYDNLYVRQLSHTISTLDIGNESLLIGYRMLRTEENQPIGTIAIPTFLNSPLYEEQLLGTTSYLLAIYLTVFGLFILGTFFFSRQLTKPLKYIQVGLNKISGGSLETMIPVQSRDEIGSLSTAYNNMVLKLKELQKNLAEAEREAAWKEMAQQVAHEIKNPLTPMKLNLQLLQRQVEQHPEDAEQLRDQIDRVTENIIEQIDSLSKIASDFSKFGRPVSGDFYDVDINELIQSVASLYSNDTVVDISPSAENGQIIVSGVADELRRTLINVVKNGLEASDPDQTITIRSIKNRQWVTIEIEDRGSGIPAGDQEKIFVPNFSTKSSGTGLGLAISKKIIEAHNGRIYFRSEGGIGTTFIIELPLKEATDRSE